MFDIDAQTNNLSSITDIYSADKIDFKHLQLCLQCSAQTRNRWGHLSHYPGKKGDI